MRVVLIFLLLHVTACASYLENRRHDLIDSASINTSLLARGMKLDLGPVSTGLYEATGSRTVKLGLGGTDAIAYDEHIEVYGVGLAAPGLKKSFLSDSLQPNNSRWGYGGKIAPFGAIKFDIGYGLTLGAQIDFLEMLDFVLGFTTIDIMQDDGYGRGEVEEKCCASQGSETKPTN